MNEEHAFNETLRYLNLLKNKTIFSEYEKDYLDYAPLSILSNRFNYDRHILNDLNFVYPLICSIEKAIGELVSRIDNIDRDTFDQKIRKLILMHSDISEDEEEKDVSKLKEKLSDIKFRNLFNFLIELKNIRNDVSHLRFDSLKYKNKSLSDYQTRSFLLFDLFNFNESWNLFQLELLEKGRLPYQKNIK